MSNGDSEEQPLSESFSQSKKTHKLSRGSAAEMEDIPMLEATMHENKLYLQISNISDMRFVTKGCYASEGQPIEENVVCELAEDGISWKLTFKAGRHNSKDVAEKYVKYLTDNGRVTGASIGCKTLVTHPRSLNFAFWGDLYITENNDTVACVGEDIVFGQGHTHKGKNNWWVGGRNMVNLFDAKVVEGVEQTFIKTNDNKEVIFACLCSFMPYPTEPNRFSITKIAL